MKLLLAVAVLGLGALAAAQTNTKMEWGIAVGGATGGAADIPGPMAMDGTDRYITANVFGANTAAADDFYEFVWSDGIRMKQVASNALMCGLISGKDHLLWIKQPRMCVQDNGNAGTGRVCQKLDDPYFGANFAAANILALGVKGGSKKPVALVTSGATSYSFVQMWWNWRFVVTATDSLLPKHGTFTTEVPTYDYERATAMAATPADYTDVNDGAKLYNDPATKKAGQWATETAGLTLKKAATTSSTFYALFSFTGDVRFSKVVRGKQEWLKTMKADIYMDECTKEDPYDMADDLVRNDYPRDEDDTADELGRFQPTWCKREGYFLMALDLGNGDLKWVQPIKLQAQVLAPGAGNNINAEGAWGTNPAFDFAMMTASDFDGAVYFAGDLKHRVWFGKQITFEEVSTVSKFEPASTINPAIDPIKTKKCDQTNEDDPKFVNFFKEEGDSTTTTYIRSCNDFENAGSPSTSNEADNGCVGGCGTGYDLETHLTLVPRTRAIFRLEAGEDGDGTAKAPLLLPAEGDYDDQRDLIGATASAEAYRRSIGTWVRDPAAVVDKAFTADDESTKIFIAGSFAPKAWDGTMDGVSVRLEKDRTLDNDDVEDDGEGCAAGVGVGCTAWRTEVDRLYLGSEEVSAFTINDETVEDDDTVADLYEDITVTYDATDAFVAAFDGSALESGSAWVSLINGNGDSPSIKFLSASHGKVWAAGTFANLTIVNQEDSRTAGDNWIKPKSSTAAENYFMIQLDGETGDFSDAATMHASDSASLDITSVGSSGSRFYAYGKFMKELTFDYLDETRDGLMAISRVDSQASLFQATFGDGMPPAGASSSHYYDKGIHLGVGIGVGLGVPLVIAIIAGIWFIKKKGMPSLGSGSGGKVAPGADQA